MPRTYLALPALIALTLCAISVFADEPTSTQASTATSAPIKVTIDQTSPKALLTTVHQASKFKDYDALVQCADPAVKPITQAAIEIVRTNKQLFAVMDDKLGAGAPELKKKVFLHEAGLTILSPAMLGGDLDWSKIKIEQQGDSASITIDGKVSKARRTEGKWYWLGQQELDKEELRYTTIGALKTLNFAKSIASKLEKGLQDGSITKDNFLSTLDKLMDESASRGEEPATATQP